MGEELASDAALVTDIDRLRSFAESVRGELEAFVTAAGEVLAPMSTEEPVNFGGGGLAEGFEFQSVYDRRQHELGQFLQQAYQGLATLASAATIISDRYADGDADSASLLAAVTEAFASPVGAQVGQPYDYQSANAAREQFQERVLAGDPTLTMPASDYHDDLARGSEDIVPLPDVDPGTTVIDAVDLTAEPEMPPDVAEELDRLVDQRRESGD